MENSIVTKIFKGISIIIMLAAVVFIALVWYHGDAAFESGPGLREKVLDPFIYTAYVAVGLCALTAVLFPIFFIAMNPKSAVRVLIALAVVVIIGFIAYSMATNQLSLETLEELQTTQLISKRVGAALIGTYIIGGLAVLSLIVSGISNLFK
ncbi:MAG: hypothetical protein K9I94_08500 [Bacteroidales bacterium]|nr:hypothetical protein [Bacteroidales bacterium]